MTRIAEEKRAGTESNAGKTAALVLWRMQHSLFDTRDLAREAGLHISMVERLVAFGAIEPVPDVVSPPLFAASAIERLQCIARLRRDLGVNLAGAAVILDMRERITSLRAELERLRQLANG